MITYEVKVYANGDRYWYLNGKLHREDGPAIEHANGGKCWYVNGLRHREDGPAREYADGIKQWYKDGVLVGATKDSSSCDGKVIKIDGKEYEMREV